MASRGGSWTAWSARATVERSTISRATVLPSALSSRVTLTAPTAVATGSRARGLASLRIWSRTGPAGRSSASRGRLDRQPGDGLLGLHHLVLAEQQAAAPPGVLVFEHEPGAVQPPVEGVQPGVLARAAAGRTGFGDDAEGLPEHVKDGGHRVGVRVHAAPGGRCHVFPVQREFPQVRRHKFRFSSGECYLQFTCPWYTSRPHPTARLRRSRRGYQRAWAWPSGPRGG